MNAMKYLPAFAALVIAASLVRADDGGRKMPRIVPDAYRQECAACHIAYPPGLLPAASWDRLMNTLEKHYGADASLDPAIERALRAWLLDNAGTGKKMQNAPLEERITRSAWFERKHRHIEPAVWRLASVKSAANCAACHAGAEKGRFNDDALIYPAGLTAAQRRAFRD